MACQESPVDHVGVPLRTQAPKPKIFEKSAVKRRSPRCHRAPNRISHSMHSQSNERYLNAAHFAARLSIISVQYAGPRPSYLFTACPPINQVCLALFTPSDVYRVSIKANALASYQIKSRSTVSGTAPVDLRLVRTTGESLLEDGRRAAGENMLTSGV